MPTTQPVCRVRVRRSPGCDGGCNHEQLCVPEGAPAIRCSVGCALIIQTIGLDPSGAVWTDEASNLSRPDPSGAVQVDAEHLARNRKVVGSNPTSGSNCRKGPLRLHLEWREERLAVAVHDGLPRLLRLAGDPGDLETEGGRGLLIADQLASR